MCEVISVVLKKGHGCTSNIFCFSKGRFRIPFDHPRGVLIRNLFVNPFQGNPDVGDGCLEPQCGGQY